MEEYPCPSCDLTFSFLRDLYDHVLYEHRTDVLTRLLEEKMDQVITKKDFTQVDSSWVYVLDGFQLTVSTNAKGEFRLHVAGVFEPIPPATQYPTEPEWELALSLANKFKDAYGVAKRHLS